MGEVPEWLTYEFPEELMAAWRAQGKGWNGMYLGQAQRWFVFRFTGCEEEEVDLCACGDPEFTEWCWAPLDSLPGEVVEHKREVYRRVADFARELHAGDEEQ